MVELILGTGNRKKGAEMLELLAPTWENGPLVRGLEVRLLADMPGAVEVDEDADSFAGNARKKASEQARALSAWVLADDSGLAVDALRGAPGVLSARYAGRHGDDLANNEKLLAELVAVPDPERGAGFQCALALADPQGTIRAESFGVCRGRVAREPRGDAGFGYDPLFLIPELHKTFGELSALVKRQLSHRARAFERIRRSVANLLLSG